MLHRASEDQDREMKPVVTAHPAEKRTTLAACLPRQTWLIVNRCRWAVPQWILTWCHGGHHGMGPSPMDNPLSP